MKIHRMLDWASGDGNTADFAKIKAAGYDVVGLRRSACYWNGRAWVMYDDTTFRTLAPAARAAGLTAVLYDFGIYAKGAPSPVDQFAFSIKCGEPVPGVDLPPCIDFEWESFRNLLQSPVAVCNLLTEHVDARRARYGCASVYTSANELFDLGEPALSHVGGSSVSWTKTAYPVGAGQAPYQGFVPLPHAGDLTSDPHGYYLVPKPWTCARMQQTQGDARQIPGLSHQADTGRFFATEPGDVGPLVAEVQRLLDANHGATLKPDGNYGPMTGAAVRAVQAKYGLPQDGVVEPATFARISWPAAKQ